MTDPAEWIDDARPKIAELYGRRLAMCDELLRYVLDLLEPWSGRALDLDQHPHDAALAAMLSRSTNAYWATLELCRIGLAEEAAKLNRSLFEDMVDVHWTILNPELADERLREHLEHGELLIAERGQEFPDVFDLEDERLRAPDPQRRAELDGRYGDFGEKPWSGLSLHARVQQIAPMWPDNEGRHQLRFFGQIAHRENNQRLHMSAEALSDRMGSWDEKSGGLWIGPSERYEGEALLGAYWIYGQIAGELLKHFELGDPDDFHRRFMDMAEFRG
jgi:hypothetical protein